MIQIQNITKVYQSKSNIIKALDDVSLEIERGKIFALLGPNGAGKSTLIKIILGLIKPTSGSVNIFGNPVLFGSKPPIKLGYLPEVFQPVKSFRLVTFLEYFGELSGLVGDELKTRVSELLEILDLKDAAEQKLTTLSKGMLQKLLLAQAIIDEPELLILDEPTDGLDPVGRKLVRNLLLELKKKNVTIFLNSHLLSEVEMMADDIAILKKGKIAVTGNLLEILPKNQGYEIYIDSKPSIDISLNCIERGDECYIYVSSSEELQRTLTLLQNYGVSVSSVRPVKNSLEEVFFSYIKE